MVYHRTENVQARLQAREATILEAATRVFTEKGYHGATMRKIAREAGVATGTLYLYFPSKEAAFLALVDELKEAVLKAILDARQRQTGTLVKLEASIRAAIEVFAGNRDLTKIVLVQAAWASPEFEGRLNELHDAFSGFIGLELQEAIESELIEPIDVIVAARAWVGTFYEIIMAWLRNPEEDLLQTIPSLIRYNLRAIGAPGY